MTGIVHPAFRRLCTSGAAASRMHTAMERAERALHPLVRNIDGLSLLDATLLDPLTKRVGVGDGLTRNRTESALPPARADDQQRSAEMRATARAVPPTRLEPAAGQPGMGDRLPPATPETIRDRTTRHEIQRVSHRCPPFPDVSPSRLRQAEAAVAQRLALTPFSATARLKRDARANDGTSLDMSPPGRATARALDEPPRRTAAATARFRGEHAPTVGAVASVRIGAVSRAVGDILDRALAPLQPITLAATRATPASGEAVSSSASTSAALHAALGTRLLRAAERAERARPSEWPERDAHESLRASDVSESAGSAATGLRRLIARAGVRASSAPLPPQAGVERAEGSTGVVADRMDDTALAARLARLLRREALRDGIDLDGTSA